MTRTTAPCSTPPAIQLHQMVEDEPYLEGFLTLAGRQVEKYATLQARLGDGDKPPTLSQRTLDACHALVAVEDYGVGQSPS
ncbi:unnamed protein product [Lota lota]